MSKGESRSSRIGSLTRNTISNCRETEDMGCAILPRVRRMPGRHRQISGAIRSWKRMSCTRRPLCRFPCCRLYCVMRWLKSARARRCVGVAERIRQGDSIAHVPRHGLPVFAPRLAQETTAGWVWLALAMPGWNRIPRCIDAGPSMQAGTAFLPRPGRPAQLTGSMTSTIGTHRG